MAMLYGKFKMPESIKVEDSSPTFARVIVEPLERGFGNTVGNSLRRVLMSSIEAPAVISVRIDNVLHEFMAIDGVLEDVTDIVLNCKDILLRRLQTTENSAGCSGKVFTCDTEISVTREDLDACGGVFHVRIKDLNLDPFAAVNPDFCLFRITTPQKRLVSLKISTGRGYVVSERHMIDDRKHGEIVLDTCFSPVRLVNYYVENTRVGQDTDFDRLVMEVTTDARITPIESILCSSQIIGKHFDFFVDQLEGPSLLFDEENVGFGRADVDDLMVCLSTRIDDIEFSVRASNCLKSARIEYVVELVSKQENELLEYRNFGKKSLSEIKAKLVELGLSLGIDLTPYGITKDNCREVAEAYLEEKEKEKKKKKMAGANETS